MGATSRRLAFAVLLVTACASPIITANWEANSDDRWTVPLGAGAGKIVRIGKLPVNVQGSAYYNVVRPDNAAEWQLRIQVQLLFPR